MRTLQPVLTAGRRTAGDTRRSPRGPPQRPTAVLTGDGDPRTGIEEAEARLRRPRAESAWRPSAVATSD
ncbi:hypothetical protein AN218_03470 [Streptomyces nanshensis]|uniref:Uncharacterized protein n=1 Tax=Streptomyces nanshensis TaxID=518642 RepID=A0A1E7LBA0_9ACTN|nr:hypothetical protein AN218_03470 [Streptomyces nanshensis]